MTMIRPDQVGELSPDESALFSTYLQQPDSRAYNIALAFGIDGFTWDSTRFRDAVERLAQRHTALRTRYRNNDGRHRTVVGAVGPVPVVATVDPDDAVARLQAYIDEPLDLTVTGAFRFVALHTGPDTLVAVVAHLIAADSDALGRLGEELVRLAAGAELPDAALRGRTELPRPEREIERTREYWRRQCADAPPLRLHTDLPRPAVVRRCGRTVTTTLPQELVGAVRGAARRHRTSSLAVMLAGFELIVATHAGQRDFLVAALISDGTDDVEIRNRLRTVPIRSSLPSAQTVGELLRGVGHTVTAGRNASMVPYARIVEDSVPAREPGVDPLCQVAFAYRRTGPGGTVLDLASSPGAEARVHSLVLTEIGGLRQQEGQFEVAVECVESSTGTRLIARFRDSLFTERRINRLLATYLRVLDAVCGSDAAAALTDLPVMADAEQARIRGFETGAEQPPAEPVLRRVRDLVERQPDRTAVVHGTERVSYRQLWRDAEAVAGTIPAGAGSPATRPVAALVPPGTGQITVALAAWLARRPFLLLDPRHPNARLRHILAEARPCALLADARTTERAGSLGGFARGFDDHPAGMPLRCIGDVEGPDDPAYVIYTSGSTGDPKGVVLGQRGLANLAHWQTGFLAVTPDDRILQFASPAFDAFVAELVQALYSGATLCVPAVPGPLVGGALVDALVQTGATVCILPPSVLATIEPQECPPGVRLIVSAGEALPDRLAERWCRSVRLVNAYGPTETTVCATAGTVTGPTAVTIGRILPGMRARVVDPAGRRVPVGVPGELWLEGVGLALRYVDESRPGGFRPATATAARAYATGDLVSWTDDGDLRYHGRLDRQIKINGNRVEPAEIEREICRLSNASDAVVVLRGPAEAPALIAYYTGADLDERTLRDRLADNLPPYLCPQFLVPLAALPLTTSGKVDHAALGRIPLPSPRPGRVGADRAALR